jgi:Ras-related protein Rab-10
METSAKSNINIEKAFCELAEAILDQTHGKDNNTDNPSSIVVNKSQDKAPVYRTCCQ